MSVAICQDTINIVKNMLVYGSYRLDKCVIVYVCLNYPSRVLSGNNIASVSGTKFNINTLMIIF